MRDAAHRRPGAVPDDDATAVEAATFDGTRADVRAGADTDGDRHPDTLLTADGTDLLVQTDLDGDGLADRVLRIGPDGSVHPDIGYADIGHPDIGHAAVGHAAHVQVEHVGQADAASDTPDSATGSVPAHTAWGALIARFLGVDP